MHLDEFKTDFLKLYGREPRIFRAPGRVNLIGEHTDYNDGFVFPAAIDLFTWVAIAPRDLETILTIDTPRWKQEMKYRAEHLEQFANLPEEIWQAHHRVAAALDDAG